MRMLIGLWILAGLVTMGINGYVLMALLDQPLAGYSSAVRQVGQSIRTYQLLMTTKAEKMSFGMDFLSQRFASKAPTATVSPVIEKATSPSAAEKKTSLAAPVSLPILSGIVTRRSADGGVGRMAFLNERLFSEGDKVGDLVVNQIRTDGVLLARGQTTWFIKAPEIAHSITTR